jgi:ankyrin repeat protein
MTDEEIGTMIRSRGLEEAYVRELLASLGYDPRDGFTMDGITALDSATMEQRRAAALRTLEMGPDDEDDIDEDGGGYAD